MNTLIFLATVVGIVYLCYNFYKEGYEQGKEDTIERALDIMERREDKTMKKVI